MLNLKVLVLILVLHNSLASPFAERWPLWNLKDLLHFLESVSADIKFDNESSNAADCPEGHSSLSKDDVNEMIDYVVNTQQINEHITNSYHEKAVAINKKYVEELQCLQIQVEEPPTHIKHLIKDFQNGREKAEPIIKQIEVKMKEIDTLEIKFNEVVKRSEKLLAHFEKSKLLCQLNCGDPTLFSRPTSHKQHDSSRKYCLKIKELYSVITVNLTNFQNEFSQELLAKISYRDNIYQNNMTTLKQKFNNAALDSFGQIMYDLLILQDDYYHFNKKVNNLNISDLDNIKENTLKIELLLVKLERDVEKYRSFCLSCGNNLRVKSDIWASILEALNSLEINTEEEYNENTDAIDNIIHDKIELIKENIDNNFTSIYNSLDEQLNDPKLMDLYLDKLEPIKEDATKDIEKEQQALKTLKTTVPEESLGKMLNLLSESKEMLKNLEKTKDFIDNILH